MAPGVRGPVGDTSHGGYPSEADRVDDDHVIVLGGGQRDLSGESRVVDQATGDVGGVEWRGLGRLSVDDEGVSCAPREANPGRPPTVEGRIR